MFMKGSPLASKDLEDAFRLSDLMTYIPASKTKIGERT
jgi:hypothetical protein